MSRAKKEPRVLTEAEIFYVQEKSKAGVTADEICAVLKTTVDDIINYIVKPSPGPTRTYESFGTKTKHGKEGVVIMTQTASQIGDETKKVSVRDTSRFTTKTKK